MRSKIKNKLSFIVYEHKKPPKYFEIKKSIIRSFFIAFPAVSTIFFLFGVISLVQIHVFSSKKDSAEVQALNEQIAALNTELKTITTNNTNLLAKVTKGSSKIANSQLLFKIPLAQQDFTVTESTFFQIDKFRTSNKENKLRVRFNLVNITKGPTKISGYFALKVKTNTGIFFYPQTMLKNKDEFLSFSNGESFTTSRFRPVDATFDVPYNSIDADSLLAVYVYTRAGDIIYKQNMNLVGGE